METALTIFVIVVLSLFIAYMLQFDDEYYDNKERLDRLKQEREERERCGE